MAIALTAVSAPNLLSLHRHVHLSRIPASSNSLKDPLLSKTLVFPTLHTQPRIVNPVHRRLSWQIGASTSEEATDATSSPKGSLFDGLISAVEVLCIVPPIMYSIGCLINTFLPNAVIQLQLAASTNELTSFLPNVLKQLQFAPVKEVFASQCFLLLGAVVIASLIRRRQWKTFYNGDYRGSNIDLVSKIEKLEDELKSSVRINSELSEQVEALSIPVSETAALAQKNSEATGTLTAQKDMLEKELHEILQVLLSMQEQQRRQLQLVLDVAHASKLVEEKEGLLTEEENKIGDTIAAIEEIETEIQHQATSHGGKDRA